MSLAQVSIHRDAQPRSRRAGRGDPAPQLGVVLREPRDGFGPFHPVEPGASRVPGRSSVQAFPGSVAEPSG